jgi:hypothetical protein
MLAAVPCGEGACFAGQAAGSGFAIGPLDLCR